MVHICTIVTQVQSDDSMDFFKHWDWLSLQVLLYRPPDTWHTVQLILVVTNQIFLKINQMVLLSKIIFMLGMRFTQFELYRYRHWVNLILSVIAFRSNYNQHHKMQCSNSNLISGLRTDRLCNNNNDIDKKKSERVSRHGSETPGCHHSNHSQARQSVHWWC